jgi:uncharacterized protein YjbI with pentapeptide repeats
MPDEATNEEIGWAAEAGANDILSKSPKSDEITENILKAIADASGKAQGYWISFLAVAGYLAVTIGSTTDRQLLLAEPMKLPLFDIRLPLIGFFTLAPVAFVVMHLFILVQVGLLAQNWRALNGQLSLLKFSPEQRERFLHRLDTFAVTQWLSRRQQLNRTLEPLINVLVLITLLIGPVMILVSVQIRFLPYHNGDLTDWQRLMLFLDIAALWLIWPSLRNKNTLGARVLFGFEIGIISTIAAGIATVAVVGFSLVIATVPGTKDAPEAPIKQWWVPRWLPTWEIRQGSLDHGTCSPQLHISVQTLPPIPASCLLSPKTWLSKIVTNSRVVWLPTAILFEGVDPVSGQARSLFSRNLVVPSENLLPGAVEIADGQSLGTTLSLRGRNLRYATLSRSDLHGADFGGADLRGADLSFANLREAKFNCLVALGGDDLPQTCSNLAGANLSDAELQGADLEGANMQQAFLYRSHLDGTYLVNARLKGATFGLASLAGTDFASTDLDDADTSNAYLDVANVAKFVNETCDSDPKHRRDEATRIGKFSEIACQPRDAPYVAVGIVRFIDRLSCDGDPDIRAAKIRLLCRLREPRCYGAKGLRDMQMVLSDDQDPWHSLNPSTHECGALAGEPDP